MEHQRGGAYIGKDACMSSNLKVLHIYFWFVTGKILNEVQQDCGRRKNHWVDNKQRIMILTLEQEEDEITLSLEKYQRSTSSSRRVFRSTLQSGSIEFSKTCDRELSGQPCNQEAPSFPTLPSGGTHIILVMVKGDRQKGSQVNLTIY